MERENDGWREPWDEKLLMNFKGSKVKCERCGLIIPAKDSHVISFNDKEGIGIRMIKLCDKCYESIRPTNSRFTSEISYCSDCYRQNMDKLTKIVEIASGKEVKHESQ